MIEITAGQRRDDCVALLCAEVYGSSAGLTPLVTYAAVSGELLPNHAARVVALSEGERLKSVALLILEEQGRAAELALLATPQALRGHGYGGALTARIAASTALRVRLAQPALQQFFATAGITRWLDSAAENGARIGLNAQHPAQNSAQLDAVIGVDDERILRTFKHDPATFEHYKKQFIAGLERAEGYFSALH